MNIAQYILKNKTIKIIADDNTVVNYQTLKDLVSNNSQVLYQNNIKKNDNIAIILNNSIDFAITYFKKLLPHFGELHPDEAVAIKTSIPSSSKLPTEPIDNPAISVPKSQPKSSSSKKSMSIKPKSKTTTAVQEP